METDIGNPIDYNPNLDELVHNKNEDVPHDDQEREQYYFQPQETNYTTMPPQPEKVDFFSTIEKSTWIIAFAVFLLGFFMGKTMQPVILRYT